MIIQIKNFGPISEFEIDLSKDLYLIYGENAVGKSYATRLIYCIYDSLNIDSEFVLFILSNLMKEQDEVVAKLNELVVMISDFEKNKKEIPTKLLKFFVETFILPEFQTSLENTFGNLDSVSNHLSNQKFSIHLSLKSFSFAITYNQKSKRLVIKNIKTTLKINTSKQDIPTIIQEFSLKILNLFNPKSDIIENKEFADNIKDMGTSINVFNNQIYYLPASRSGLYVALDSFGELMSELSQHRNKFIKSTIKLPSLSKPVSDYFMLMSEFYSEPNPSESLRSIANDIETDVLDGEIIKKNEQYFFRSNQTNKLLPLAFSSSMISELAPIVTFIKYILQDTSHQTQQVLFIEEPEAHLHPRLQVKLMSHFVKLSQIGVKVIITSHSNYMFDKLGNMLLSGDCNPENIRIYHLEMTEHGSIMKDDMIPDEYGMDDYNFSKVSEELYQERLALYERKHNSQS